MIFHDLYLRTETEKDMLSALRRAGLMQIVDDMEIIAPPPHTSVDVIGIIHEQTGTKVDAEGAEVPVFEPVPGWHVNVRTWDDGVADKLSHLDAKPRTPSRRWA